MHPAPGRWVAVTVSPTQNNQMVAKKINPTQATGVKEANTLELAPREKEKTKRLEDTFTKLKGKEKSVAPEWAR